MAEVGNVENFESKITVYVVVCWILAACGGLMFGYLKYLLFFILYLSICVILVMIISNIT